MASFSKRKISLRDEVRGVCEILGLDPLHIANEGQFLAVVAPEHADRALAALRATPGGEDAALVGEIRASPAGVLIAESDYGTTRVVDMLVGDPLPRSADDESDGQTGRHRRALDYRRAWLRRGHHRHDRRDAAEHRGAREGRAPGRAGCGCTSGARGENGDEFMRRYEEASQGLVDPFILVIEGSILMKRTRPKGIGQGSASIERRDNR